MSITVSESNKLMNISIILKRYRSFALTLTVKVAAAFASAFTLSIIAKGSDPIAVGQFSNFLATLLITISFMQFGFQASYFKNITKTNTISKHTILLNVLWIIAVSTSFTFYNLYMGIFDKNVVLFFGIVLSVYNTANTIMRATGLKTVTAILDNLPKNILFFILIYYASFALNIQLAFDVIIIIFGLSVTGSIIVLSFVIFQRNRRLRSLQFTTTKNAFEIAQTGLAQFIATVNRNIDIIIISYFLGFEQAASYKIAVLFLNFSQMKESAFTHVTAKRFSETNNLKNVDILRRRIGRTLIVMSVLEIVTFCIFGSFILNLFFDSSYTDAWTITIILLIGNLARDGFGPLPSIIILQNLQVMFLYAGVIRLLSSFLLIGLIQPDNLSGFSLIFALVPVIEYLILLILFKRKLFN